MPAKDPNPTLMHALGSFFGHIWKGIRIDPAAPRRQVLDQRTELETRDTPQGKVTIRRTTIEEVELPRNRPPSP